MGQWFEDIYTAKRIDDIWTNAVTRGYAVEHLGT
jgi:hypothetical protein